MAQQPTKDPRLISYDTLRKAIGWLGILLPAAMIIGNYAFGNCHMLQDSTSHYYYTVTGNLFTGILCVVAIFLIVYKGFDLLDNIVTTLAGCFAFGIAMFPTNDDSTDSCAVIHLPLNELRNDVHYWFAALFFIALAFISLFLFTKSKGPKTNLKKTRNTVYRVCGIVILVIVALLAIYFHFEERLQHLRSYKPVFWLEWVNLAAFGISWLVKGKLILEDQDKKKGDS